MKKTKKPNVIMNLPATPEQLRARLELGRSNASGTHKNKKAYTRKQKHKGMGY